MNNCFKFKCIKIKFNTPKLKQKVLTGRETLWHLCHHKGLPYSVYLCAATESPTPTSALSAFVGSAGLAPAPHSRTYQTWRRTLAERATGTVEGSFFPSLICSFTDPTLYQNTLGITSISSSPLLSWSFYKSPLSSNILLHALTSIWTFFRLNFLLPPCPFTPQKYNTESQNALGWKGPCRSSHFNPPARGRNPSHQPRVLPALPNPALDTAREGAATASQGSLGQGLTILRSKSFFLISNLNLPSFSLTPLPLVLSPHVLVQSPSPAVL